MNHKTSDELDIGFECEHEYKFLVEIRIFLLLAIILKLFQVILSWMLKFDSKFIF